MYLINKQKASFSFVQFILRYADCVDTNLHFLTSALRVKPTQSLGRDLAISSHTDIPSSESWFNETSSLRLSLHSWAGSWLQLP